MSAEKWDGQNENMVAISADFHTHNRYHDFYEHIGPRVGGFTGIYGIVVSMGLALTKWENENGGRDCWEDKPFDWQELIEHWVDHFIEQSLASCGSARPDETLNETIRKLSER